MDEFVWECHEPEGDLGKRTKQFSLRIIRMSTALPRTEEATVIRRQVIRSGTSPGAQYREARRARSTKEFISKIESGVQELDETAYWLELLIEGDIMAESRLSSLLDETNELIAMFTASAKTAKKSLKNAS